MLNFGPTFVWGIVNLIVLYFILRKLLFKPVTKFMEDRSNAIRRDMETAEKDKSEAARLLHAYEEQLKEARLESGKIIQEARARAEEEYASIIAEARRKAEEILEKSGLQVEAERRQMLKEVKNQVASLALAAASKVIEANMDTEKNRALVGKFIDKEGVA